MALTSRAIRARALSAAAALTLVVLVGAACRQTPSPPSNGNPTTAPAAASESPTLLVEQAIAALTRWYIEPLDASELHAEAWDGAADALRRAGVTNLPPMPAYPADDAARLMLHQQTFPELERLAASSIGTRALVDAALSRIAARRENCHTAFYPYRPPDARPELSTSERETWLGIHFTDTRPPRILHVFPGSAAWDVGLARGQAIESIDGKPVKSLNRDQLVERLEGRVDRDVRLRVRGLDGRGETRTFMLEPAPLVGAEVLDHGIALIRFDTLVWPGVLRSQLEELLDALEDQGVRGWIIDLRFNTGGYRGEQIAGLFVQEGRVYSASRRDSFTIHTGPGGRPFHTQRPLVILTGTATYSYGEVLAGSLQSLGRATLVGERTSGCIELTYEQTLRDGSTLTMASQYVSIGPEGRQLRGTGIEPDVVVPAAADVSRPDPQIEAAVRRLTGQGTR